MTAQDVAAAMMLQHNAAISLCLRQARSMTVLFEASRVITLSSPLCSGLDLGRAAGIVWTPSKNLD